jgi:uncharacterized protein
MNITISSDAYVKDEDVCTFADCMGIPMQSVLRRYLTLLPVCRDGLIYVMGNVRDRQQAELEINMQADVMNALGSMSIRIVPPAPISDTAGGDVPTCYCSLGGEITGVDPHCIAYKRIFDEITERMNEAMYAPPPCLEEAVPYQMGVERQNPPLWLFCTRLHCINLSSSNRER